MEILKTTVGHHLTNLFPENVAFDIAALLVEDPEERRETEQYKALFETLYTATKKGKNMIFLKYCKNLRYDAFGVCSYDTEVIQLNWKHRTAKRLGRWSKTTSTHMNYAIRILEISYDFTEIK